MGAKESMKIQTHNILTILISIILGLILSVINILSLGWLQLCQFKGQLLLEVYYFIPVTVFLVVNMLLYFRFRKTDWKIGLVIVELMLLCSNVWFAISASIPLNCVIDTTSKRIYAALYYGILLSDLIIPLAFLYRLLITNKHHYD